MNYREIKLNVINSCYDIQEGIEKKDRNAIITALKSYREVVLDSHYNNQMCGEGELMQLERKTLRKVALFLTDEFPN